MKITFLGAGSTIFAKNVLGDCILTEKFGEFEIALYDIDTDRLEESFIMLQNINTNYNGKAKIHKFTNRKEALRNADYIVNAIQVGGFQPATVVDFEIPKKYGLRQTIGDTLGIGGIFRALRTIYVLEDIAKDIKEVCKDALFLNYTNPMSMLTIYLADVLGINTVGLCHSVQVCVEGLFNTLDMKERIPYVKSEIAGINHQAWLLKIEDLEGNDLYPEIKQRSLSGKYDMDWDLVRHDLMSKFGYYNTESSEHTAEYNNWFIKKDYPELIEKFKIPLDEYPRRCIEQISTWNQQRKDLVENIKLEHKLSNEFAAKIIKAIEFDEPTRIHGNVMNNNLITNLPNECSVEVACLVDRNGVQPTVIGDLPVQLAAINRQSINVQLLTVEAAKTRKKEYVYQAAYLDPHASSELSMDEIKQMCDELFAAHKQWLPQYM